MPFASNQPERAQAEEIEFLKETHFAYSIILLLTAVYVDILALVHSGLAFICPSSSSTTRLL